MNKTIDASLWILPWVILLGVLSARVALPVDDFRQRFMGELGPIELGTVVFLGVAIVIGIKLLRRPTLTGLQRGWYLLVLLGCVYFGGEELSWGQHLAGWSTPDAIAQLNDQQETNLHNMSSWLDQKPRLALELWIVLGALLALSRTALGATAPLAEPWRWALPGLACASCGLAVLLARLPERLAEFIPAAGAAPFDIRLAELQEMLIGLHLLTYLWFALGRLANPKGRGQAQNPG